MLIPLVRLQEVTLIREMGWSEVRPRDLTVSNHLLGNRQALDAAWQRDGYWFFRNVVDLGAIARLRAVYMNVLSGMGLVDPADPEAVWTKAALDELPFRMDPLVHLQAWRGFVAERSVHDLFRQILDDEPFWIPTPEYRAWPPARDRSADRIDVLHRDSFYNPGIPFIICWIPLSEIDEQVGGIAVAEGMQHASLPRDFEKPNGPIPLSAIPPETWRRSDYNPGDLLMMQLDLPHSGLHNHSDRFRLSMDIRVMPASGNVPFIGTLTAVEPGAIHLRDKSNQTATFLLDELTYCRGLDGVPVPFEQIERLLQIGKTWIVASENGRARVVRPPH